jgi:hypothetical protein
MVTGRMGGRRFDIIKRVPIKLSYGIEISRVMIKKSTFSDPSLKREKMNIKLDSFEFKKK